MLIASQKKTGSPICRIIINSIVFICHNSVAQHGGMLHSRHNMRWPFFALLPPLSSSLTLCPCTDHLALSLVPCWLENYRLHVRRQPAQPATGRRCWYSQLATCATRNSRLSTREIQFQWKQLNSGKKVSRHANVERSTQSGTMVVPAIIMNWSVRCQSAQTQPENGQCEELSHTCSLILSPCSTSPYIPIFSHFVYACAWCGPFPCCPKAKQPSSQPSSLPLAPVSCGLRQDTVHAQLQPRPGTQCCC